MHYKNYIEHILLEVKVSQSMMQAFSFIIRFHLEIYILIFIDKHYSIKRFRNFGVASTESRGKLSTQTSAREKRQMKPWQGRIGNSTLGEIHEVQSWRSDGKWGVSSHSQLDQRKMPTALHFPPDSFFFFFSSTLCSICIQICTFFSHSSFQSFAWSKKLKFRRKTWSFCFRSWIVCILTWGF